MKHDKQAQAQAIETLREWLPDGSEVYTVLTHCSESGMTRGIKVVAVLTEEGRTIARDISWAVGRALGAPLHQKGGVKVTGAGMDMGFDVVYSLSQVLYGMSEGGYKLTHRWL